MELNRLCPEEQKKVRTMNSSKTGRNKAMTADISTIMALLTEADGTNSDILKRQSAIKALDELRNVPGYPTGNLFSFFSLLSIWQLDKPQELRFKAMAKFKNDCEQIWHVSKIKSIEKEKEKMSEKEVCKCLLLNNYMKENDEIVLRQVSQSISKLTQIEMRSSSGSSKNNAMTQRQVKKDMEYIKVDHWDEGWPQLMSYLTSNLQSSSRRLDPMKTYKLLLLMNDICQVMSHGTKLDYIHFFNHVANHLLPTLCVLWDHLFQFFFAKIGKCSIHQFKTFFAMCQFASYSIRIIINSIYPITFQKDSICGNYVAKVFQNVGQLHENIYPRLVVVCVEKLPGKDAALCTVMDSVRHLVDDLLAHVAELHKNHAMPFQEVLSPFLRYYYNAICNCHAKTTTKDLCKSTKDSTLPLYMDEVVVHALLFFKNVLQSAVRKTLTTMKRNERILERQDVCMKNGVSLVDKYELTVGQFCNENRMKRLANVLLKDWFVLKEEELATMSDNACEYFQETMIDSIASISSSSSFSSLSSSCSAHLNIRMAATKLFQVAMETHPQYSVPVIVSMITQALQTSTTTTTTTTMTTTTMLQWPNESEDKEHLHVNRLLLQKEAAYFALGLGYSHFTSELSTAQQLDIHGSLQQIVDRDLSQYKHVPFLIARIMWLFGHLSHCLYLHSDTLHFAYRHLLHWMARPAHLSSDIVDNPRLSNRYLFIRIQAAQSLKNILSDNKFNGLEFEPTHLHKTCRSLIQLVGDCSPNYSVMSTLLNCLCFVVQRCKNAIRKCDLDEHKHCLSMDDTTTNENNNEDNYNCGDNNNNTCSSEMKKEHEIQENGNIIECIVNAIPKLWTECNSTDTNLLQVSIIDMLIQLVSCMTVGQIHQFYPFLLTVLNHSTNPTAKDRLYLIESGVSLWNEVLYRNYCHCFEELIAILRCYVMIGREDFVKRHGKEIGESILTTLPQITTDENIFSCVFDLLGLFISLFPSQSPMFFKPIIDVTLQDFFQLFHHQSLQRSQPFSTFNTIAVADYNDDTESDHAKSEHITTYAMFYCRLLIENVVETLNVLKSLEKNETIVDMFIRCLLDCSNYVNVPYKKRILCFGYVKLVQLICTYYECDEHNNEILLSCLQDIVPYWFSLINDYEIVDFSVFDHSNSNLSSSQIHPNQWNQHHRMNDLICKDVVNQTLLLTLCKNTIETVSKTCNITPTKLLTDIGRSKNLPLCKMWDLFVNKYSQYLQEKKAKK
ncbi:hypothetical protein RFI_11784 [Reticulomyxa filosa]|uniref:Importin-7/11-like TPR repeats domain-containing protein n=1 Tax=Reticulomyxa filosa TaxID=46433 RepID=X6NJ31_RETFI|nr:hypothetical protein RFI_11784 [Reticulomyxa filosa]|eukprot:ETO25352.1 hypothetical protein RFI_11784 [Reticulomyxa filosa]